MPSPDSRPTGRGEPSRPAQAPLPALCPQCGEEVPVMEALVYHGIVYHPACVYGEGEIRRRAR
jgi:hypothetical protein